MMLNFNTLLGDWDGRDSGELAQIIRQEEINRYEPKPCVDGPVKPLSETQLLTLFDKHTIRAMPDKTRLTNIREQQRKETERKYGL